VTCPVDPATEPGTRHRTAELGIFARIFRRATPAAVADAIAAAGFGLTQLNLSAFGLPTIPEPGRPQAFDPQAFDPVAVRAAFERRRVRIWGLSATYNTVHPDQDRRARETAAAAAFIPSAAALGAQVVTLCSGTRDPDDMWRRHPGNDERSAWRDLRQTLDTLLPSAAAAGVQLGIEPEPSNVIRDATTARRLLDELGPDAQLVGIVLDPANLLDTRTAGDQDRILAEAFDVLGPAVVCVHAKDVVASGYAAAGMGTLDYDLVFGLHAALPRTVPVIIQDAAEDDVARTRSFLLDHARRHA
jgi:sugar phosphate isomerase/epimerase